MTRFWVLDFGFSIGRSKSASAFSFALGALLFALSSMAEAQQPAKMARIGYAELALELVRMKVLLVSGLMLISVRDATVL